MAIIERIQRLKHPGTLSDFRWPLAMPSFGRYNSIYGWNGSGKTIISRLLRAVEMRAPVDYEVVLSINGRNFNGTSDFQQINTKVRVFNRDFVSANVFPGSGDVAPILVLGEDSVQKQQEIERLKSNQAIAEATLNQAESDKSIAINAIDRYCIERARAIKELLRSSGPNPYNNYNKTNYQNQAEEIRSANGENSVRLSEDDRKKLLAQQRARIKQKIEEIDYQVPNLSMHVTEVQSLLNTSVVSEVIESLKDDEVLSSWVYEGLGLHQTRGSIRCLFCDQALPNNRIATLETHFSAEYDRFLERLDGKLRILQRAAEEVDGVQLRHPADFYEDLVEEYTTAAAKLEEVFITVKTFLATLMESVSQKKSRPFDSYPLDTAIPTLASGTIDQVNDVVHKHNRACDEFDTRVHRARKRLEDDSIQGSLEEFNRLVGDFRSHRSAADRASNEVKSIRESIALLEQEIIEHRRPADELNKDLHRYLGHCELQLAVRQTGYEIMRNGVRAQSLSEGESTAIALLYFLKSLQDRDFDVTQGVVVLDDPVSSLDSNALYLAFGFIRERTQDVAQLFILTHNFTFFRNVRNWFHHLKDQRKKDINQRPARFYMLESRFHGTNRFSVLSPLDPLLERYDSEYQYLFSRIYSEAHGPSATSLEENYILPNIARRLLEGFLAFRQPQISGELWKKMEAMDSDQAEKLRILRYVHTYSHSNSIGEPGHDLSLLAESCSVLLDILRFMETHDPEHFRAMEQLTRRSAQDGDYEQ